MTNETVDLKEFTCGWKYFDPLDLPQKEQRGTVKVRAADIHDAIVEGKKAVFAQKGLSARRVEITTIEEDFL